MRSKSDRSAVGDRRRHTHSASDQGRFWAYRNVLFTGSPKNGAELKTAAQAANLDGIRLEEGTQVLGSIHAGQVEIGAGATFRDHRYLEPLKIDPSCINALQEALKNPLVGQ